MTTHIIYDTETTGPNPSFDQILQAAAIKTDDDFNEIDTIDMRSRLSPHIIPTAGALKVTGIDPNDIARAPHSAHEFACRLHQILETWSDDDEISYDGYNTIRFDEEILRQTFWQNLLHPYITSGRNKTRMDYLNTTRALHARNPDVIDFPISAATGKKNFKLENIAIENGFAEHDAHDALGDVRATIFMARLIRDIDPDLFAHMAQMGNANIARDFIDNEMIFRLIGGPMLNPGALDMCLIGSEKANPKNKLAWNLAIDPAPYLDLPAENILEVMKTRGTPFKTVKANKQPGVFPMSWGFLNLVSNDCFSPATPREIDERAEMICQHDAFRHEASRALALRTESYEAHQHLEEKIYSGFPSHADKNRMTDFHNETDWTRRLDIVRSFEKPELRAIGLRVVFLNAPHALSDTLRSQIDEKIAEERYTLETDRPWTTVGSLMKELDSMQAEDPDNPALATIRTWALASYPTARSWTAGETRPDEAAPACDSGKETVGTIVDTATSYLDGLD